MFAWQYMDLYKEITVKSKKIHKIYLIDKLIKINTLILKTYRIIFVAEGRGRKLDDGRESTATKIKYKKIYKLPGFLEPFLLV